MNKRTRAQVKNLYELYEKKDQESTTLIEHFEVENTNKPLFNRLFKDRMAILNQIDDLLKQ